MITIKRKARHVLSTTYYSPKTSTALGGILILMGVIILLIALTSGATTDELPPRMAVSLSITFMLAGFFFFLPYYTFRLHISHPLSYRPFAIGIRNIIGSLMALLFIVFFLSVFYGIPGLRDHKDGFLILKIFSVLFPVIFGFIFLREIWYTVRDLKYGTSSLQLSTPMLRGEVSNGTFSNSKLAGSRQPLDVYLRNLREHPAANRNRSSTKGKHVSSNSFITEVLYEQHQSVSLHDASATLSIAIPESGDPTDYRADGSTYWELEVSQSDTGFHSRFLIAVIP